MTGGGEGDAALRAWNPKTGDCLSTIQGHTFHSEGSCCCTVKPCRRLCQACKVCRGLSIRLQRSNNLLGGAR